MKYRCVKTSMGKDSGAVLPLAAISIVLLLLITLVMTQFLVAVEDSVKNVSNVTQTIIQMTRNLPNRRAAYDAGIWAVILNQDLDAQFPPRDRYAGASKVQVEVDGSPNVQLSYSYPQGETARVTARSSESTTFLTDAFLGFLNIFQTSAEFGGKPSSGALFFGFDNSFSMRGAPENVDLPPDQIGTPIQRLLEAANIPVATRGEANHFCYPISMQKIEMQLGRDLSFQEEVEMCYFLAGQLPYATTYRELPIGFAHWNSNRSDSVTYANHRGSIIPAYPSMDCGCTQGSGTCPSSEKLQIWGYNPGVSLAVPYCELLSSNMITRVCGLSHETVAVGAPFPEELNMPGWRTTVFDHTTCPQNRYLSKDVANGTVSSALLCQPMKNPVTNEIIEISDGDICRAPFQYNSVFLTRPEVEDLERMTTNVGGISQGEILLRGSPPSQYVSLVANLSDFWMTAKQLTQSALIGLSERFPHLGFYVFSAPHPYGSFQETTPDGKPIRGVFEFHNWRSGNIYEEQIHLQEDLLSLEILDATGQVKTGLKNMSTVFPQIRLNESLVYWDHEEFPNLNPKPGTKPQLEPAYKYSVGHSLKAREYLNVIDNPLHPFPSSHGALSWQLEEGGYPGNHPASYYHFPVGGMTQIDLRNPPGIYPYFPRAKLNPVWSDNSYQIHPSWSKLGKTSKPLYSFGNLKDTDLQSGLQSGAPLSIPSAINNPVGAFAYLTPSLGGTNTHELFAQFADDCQEYRDEMNDSRARCTALIITDGEPRVHSVQQGFDQLAQNGEFAQLTAIPQPSFGAVDAPGTLMHQVNNELLRFEADGNTFVFLIFIQHQETLNAQASYFLSLFDAENPNGINTNPQNRALFRIDYEDPDDFREKMVSVLRLAIVLLSDRSKLLSARTQ